MSFNSLCYLGLGALSSILLAFVYFKTKNNRSLFLFMGMIGVGYTVEFVIYVLLGSYQYEPKIISRDAYYDGNMGAIASNALTLPATATLIATFRLRWTWIAVITGLIVGIEWLFLKLGIYHHNWWRLEYTAISLLLYYGLARAWFPRLMRPLKGILHSLTLYAITWGLSTLQFLPIPLFNSRYYNVGWFDSRSHDTTAFSSVFWMLSSGFYVLAVKLQWKYTWLKYVLPVAIVFGVNIILKIYGVLHSLVWWDFLYCFVMSAIVIIVIDAISKRLWKGAL